MDATQKLAQFLEEVNQSIDLRIQDEQNEAEKEADALVKASEERSIAEADAKLSAAKTEIVNKYQKKISQTGFRCKTALLQRRETLLQEMFYHLREKLTAFAASAEYAAWMENLLKKHQPAENAVVLLKEADLSLQSRLAAVCVNPCSFRADHAIRIGGLSILDADGTVCDNHTLDESYLTQTRNFYRNHHLDGGAEEA